jgi:hypothetical protein
MYYQMVTTGCFPSLMQPKPETEHSMKLLLLYPKTKNSGMVLQSQGQKYFTTGGLPPINSS